MMARWPRTLVFSALFFFAATLLLSACEAVPGGDEPEETDPRVGACYHFEISGPLEYSATCRDYNVSQREEGGLTITLVAPPIALFLDLPDSLSLGQYKLGTRQQARETPGMIGAEVRYHPLEDQEGDYSEAIEGTLTLMRFDETGVSALYRFSATPRGATAEEAIQVSGHLRDLSLKRQED